MTFGQNWSELMKKINMKKNTSLIVLAVLFISFLGIHKATVGSRCNLDKPGVDSYANQVLSESAGYRVQEEELDRQATDGSNRKIFTDKNEDVVLIEDTHSGESGFRSVYVIFKNEKAVKVIDVLTHYIVPPIEDPNSEPIITEDEFYIKDSGICSWYKQGKLISQSTLNEQEYLNVIKQIVSDAENVAGIIQ